MHHAAHILCIWDTKVHIWMNVVGCVINKRFMGNLPYKTSEFIYNRLHDAINKMINKKNWIEWMDLFLWRSEKDAKRMIMLFITS